MFNNNLQAIIRLGLVMSPLLWSGNALAAAATNAVTDAGGGSVTLTTSGDVSVTDVPLTLEKQVWVGGTCYASSSNHADCTGDAAVTVPENSSVKFMIYIQNTSQVSLTDVRFQDVLKTGADEFTYTSESIRSDSSQNGTAVPGDIYTAVTAGVSVAESDATGAGLASVTGSTIQVGLTDSSILVVPANTTFAIIFDAIKK
jgi:uncharacterized repeat protein (TIGR01451 family)